MVDLSVQLGNLRLKNPVMAASGTFGYGEEFRELYDISRLGAVITKGISLKPRTGNPMPRTVETPSGMLNAIGLQNVGCEEFLAKKLPFLVKAGATTIVNIFGESVDEYATLAKKLDGVKGVAAIEVNISCPNVKAGGVQFGIDPKEAARVTKAVRKVTDAFLIVKLSPHAPDIPAMARAMREAGAGAISLINTILGMAIDVEKRRPVLSNVVGGLSGPAIKPIALRMVWEANKALNDGSGMKGRFPIIGIGGIASLDDLLQFLLAGADAVQIGTANFVRPNIAIELIRGLKEYLESRSIEKVSDLVGKLKQ